MVKIKVINISPHSPAGAILEVEEAKAMELVKLKQVIYAEKIDSETKKEKASFKKIETKL